MHLRERQHDIIFIMLKSSVNTIHLQFKFDVTTTTYRFLRTLCYRMLFSFNSVPFQQSNQITDFKIEFDNGFINTTTNTCKGVTEGIFTFSSTSGQQKLNETSVIKPFYLYKVTATACTLVQIGWPSVVLFFSLLRFIDKDLRDSKTTGDWLKCSIQSMDLLSLLLSLRLFWHSHKWENTNTYICTLRKCTDKWTNKHLGSGFL